MSRNIRPFAKCRIIVELYIDLFTVLIRYYVLKLIGINLEGKGETRLNKAAEKSESYVLRSAESWRGA